MPRDDFHVVDSDDHGAPPVEIGAMRRTFSASGEGRYVFGIPDLQLEFDVDRLRRERHELKGELAVRCGLAGARAVNGNSLSLADFNLSSARARTERAPLRAGSLDPHRSRQRGARRLRGGRSSAGW